MEIESLIRQLNYITWSYGRPLPNKSAVLREIENGVKGRERERGGGEGRGERTGKEGRRQERKGCSDD